MKKVINLGKNSAEAVSMILESDVSDPVSAVEGVGGDITVFFKNFDWSFMDFRPSELSRVSFENAILDNAIFYEDQLETVLASGPKSTKNLQVSKRPRRSAKRQAVQGDRKLDPLDLLLLELVQNDGRETVSMLASKLSISTDATQRRLQRLEHLGYILGYYADVDSRKLGFETTVFLFVGLSDQSESAFSQFEEACLQISTIRQCHMLNGEVDFVLKCELPDLKEAQAFVDQMVNTANVASIKSSLVIRSSAEKAGVPFEVFEHFIRRNVV